MKRILKENRTKDDENLELVAAIIGALSMHTGKKTYEFKIKSIKRIDEFKWLDY